MNPHLFGFRQLSDWRERFGIARRDHTPSELTIVDETSKWRLRSRRSLLQVDPNEFFIVSGVHRLVGKGGVRPNDLAPLCSVGGLEHVEPTDLVISLG